MIYLDNAATTRIKDDVLSSMLPFLTDNYWNAGAFYSAGRRTKEHIESARENVRKFINTKDGDTIVFTSGGTESNNLVLYSVVRMLTKRDDDSPRHFIVSSTEHDSVLKTARLLCKENNIELTELPVDRYGMVEVGTLLSEIRDNTSFVSVMFVNNETGTRNPVEDIGAICKKRGILFHTDAVQAAGSFPIDVHRIGCDFLSISSHKIHGPKGVGALYVRKKDMFVPTIIGGKTQEYGLRGGTENVAGIVGFGTACSLLTNEAIKDNNIHTSLLKQVFYKTLYDSLQDCGISEILHINGRSVVEPGKVLNLRFDGIDGETLILLLDNAGIFVSAGSACHSLESEPSHVLISMGLTPAQARSSIRVSFSEFNTESEVVKAAAATAECVNTLIQ